VLETVGLVEEQRYELIEGKLIRKMGKNRPHMDALAYLIQCLQRIFGPLRVMQEPSIDVAPEDNPTSEPEPDAVVFTRPFREIQGRFRPEDLALVVEVSAASLAFDLSTKAALYARAKIQEYWVLDVNGRRLIVHRDPVDGQFQSVLVYSEDESIAPLAAADQFITVRDLL